MKNLIVLFALIAFKTYAQPVHSPTGTLAFKVYKDGKQVDLSNSSWKIEPKNITLSEKQVPYRYPDFYRVSPVSTYMGGLVQEDFFLNIIFKNDTMQVHPPNFRNSHITLDSVPFSPGIYILPPHIYSLKNVTSSKYKNFIPRINGNWKFFRGDYYKCYIEKVKALDMISDKNTYCAYSEKWDELSYGFNMSFRNNIIIWHSIDPDYEIYQVKNVMDTTFMGHKLKDRDFVVKILYKEGDDIFGLIQKNYSNYGERTYGIYKLHFVSYTISEDLKTELAKKQIEEDYQAAVKIIKNRNRGATEKQLALLKDVFEKSMKEF